MNNVAEAYKNQVKAKKAPEETEEAQGNNWILLIEPLGDWHDCIIELKNLRNSLEFTKYERQAFSRISQY